MLCTHKTASSASLVLEICPNFANPYLTQFSSISGGNCITTPLKEKSLAYSMNMPTLRRDHPFIHQVNLNGLGPMLMKNLSKLVVPNLSLLWMDILSLSSSRMVWPMPPPLEDPQIRTWTHIHMSSSHLLMNGIPQSLTMILHTLMDWTPVKSLANPLVTPCLMLMVISMSASLPTSTPSWMNLKEIVGHTQKSLLFSQPISIRLHPKSLTGMLYAHFCMDIPIQHQGHFQCHHQAWNCSTHPGLHQKAL